MKKWEKVNSETKITKLSALFACVCVCVGVCMAVCVCSSVYIVVFLLFYININVGRCGKQASFFISFVDSSELKKFYGWGIFSMLLLFMQR